ncbi:hypothetical protein OH491_01500 [Termitidicoccus mucosus]|uniref:hypothetical protein n=1 Tax=Termitidicoccus mucosus TaxID=1184151 RepID=UPI0011AB5594
MPSPRLLLSLLSVILLLVGCASAPKPSAPESPTAQAAKARYWAIQAAQKPAPVSSEFELLPIVRPERTVDGVIVNPSTDYLPIRRIP